MRANALFRSRPSSPRGVGLRPEDGLPVRTLVLTVAGAGHRVQDDPRALDLLRDFSRS